jgi:hypothetical protein
VRHLVLLGWVVVLVVVRGVALGDTREVLRGLLVVLALLGLLLVVLLLVRSSPAGLLVGVSL